jgi:sRNA-binding carbon storage regulator CsrA
MLVLTRRVGETIYIGDDICLTIYDKLCYHVMVGVVASPNINIEVGGTRVRHAILPDGNRFYLLTLLSQEVFLIGEAHVRVRFPPSLPDATTQRARQVWIGIHAPRSIVVDREEIHARKLAESGSDRTKKTLPEWLRRANLAVSSRAVA